MVVLFFAWFSSKRASIHEFDDRSFPIKVYLRFWVQTTLKRHETEFEMSFHGQTRHCFELTRLGEGDDSLGRFCEAHPQV